MISLIKRLFNGTPVTISPEQQLADWHANGKPAPPPHIVKQQVLQHYKNQYHLTVLVETGTYLGDMMEAQTPHFSQLYSIELSEKLFKKATNRFATNNKITILQGDSGKVLHTLVPQLNTATLFWLDGHYSAGITAKGEKDCPIFEELEAIFATNLPHIVLVDDARLFVGQGDYPTVAELTAFVESKKSGYDVFVEDDIIRILPK